MDKELSRLLDESIQVEMNVAALHLSFHHTFPEDAEFWWQLADDKDHTRRIQDYARRKGIGKSPAGERGAMQESVRPLIRVHDLCKALTPGQIV